MSDPVNYVDPDGRIVVTATVVVGTVVTGAVVGTTLAIATNPDVREGITDALYEGGKAISDAVKHGYEKVEGTVIKAIDPGIAEKNKRDYENQTKKQQKSLKKASYNQNPTPDPNKPDDDKEIWEMIFENADAVAVPIATGTAAIINEIVNENEDEANK